MGHRNFYEKCYWIPREASAFKLIIDKVNRRGNVFFTVKSSVEGKQVQSVEELGCLFLMNGFLLNLEKSLRMNIRCASRNVEYGNVVIQTLRKHLSKGSGYKHVDLRGTQRRKTYDLTKEGDIMLTFKKSAWICGCCVIALEDCDWKEKKKIVKE